MFRWYYSTLKPLVVVWHAHLCNIIHGRLWYSVIAVTSLHSVDYVITSMRAFMSYTSGSISHVAPLTYQCHQNQLPKNNKSNNKNRSYLGDRCLVNDLVYVFPITRAIKIKNVIMTIVVQRHFRGIQCLVAQRRPQLQDTLGRVKAVAWFCFSIPDGVYAEEDMDTF